MKRVEVNCDICGRLKRESSHWFQCALNPSWSQMIIVRDGVPGPGWSGDGFDVYDICGSHCLYTLVSRWCFGQDSAMPQKFVGDLTGS